MTTYRVGYLMVFMALNVKVIMWVISLQGCG